MEKQVGLIVLIRLTCLNISYKAINKMIQYFNFSFKPAEDILKSLKKHSWYLNERIMIMCLADKCLPVDHLHKLAQTAKPVSYRIGKLSSKIFIDNKNKITRKKNEDFIGPESWFFFDFFKITLHKTE